MLLSALDFDCGLIATFISPLKYILFDFCLRIVHTYAYSNETTAFPTIFAAPLQNPYELQLGGLDATVAVPIMVVVCIGLLMLSLVSAILLIMSITTLPKNFAGEFIYEFRLYITVSMLENSVNDDI